MTALFIIGGICYFLGVLLCSTAPNCRKFNNPKWTKSSALGSGIMTMVAGLGISVFGIIMMEGSNDAKIAAGCIVGGSAVLGTAPIIFAFLNKKSNPFVPIYIGVGTFLVILIAVIVIIATDVFFTPSEEKFDENNIKFIVKTEVEKKLKAPSTAEFSNLEVKINNDTWTITGYVDSQNSFGAMIRNSFTVTIRDEGYPYYDVISIEFSDDAPSSKPLGENDKATMETIAKREVLDRLKAPSTAKFSNVKSSEKNGTWTISGRVDSQNGFGATVSTKFTIVLKVVREHPYYTVVSVTFD